MAAVRLVLVLIVVFALLVRPSLWPFVAAGLLATLLVSLLASARGELRATLRAPAVVAVVIATLVAVAAVIAVIEGGGGGDSARHSGAPAPAFVSAVYEAHLTLAHTRDLRVQETLALEGGPRQSFTRGLAADGWRPGLHGGRPVYVRSTTRHLDVPGVLPPKRTNRFEVPDVTVPLQRLGGVRGSVALSGDSRITLDAPRNAIGDTFPAGTSGRGPDHRMRVTLPLPDFANSVEFDVRSPPFRNPILATAADVTIWTPFGWLLGLAIPLINDRVRDLVLGSVRRGLQRRRVRRQARNPTRATKAL